MTTPAPIVVSMGDPAGVGPEIILKAWHQLRHHPMAFAVIGEFDLFARSAEALGLAAPIPVDTPAQALEHFAECLPVLGTEAALSEPVVPGQPNPAHAAATKAAIEAGVRYCLNGEASALVTAPIAKSVMYEAGFTFPGHTEFLAGLTAHVPQDGPRGPAMMLTGGGLRVVLVTIHEPLQRAIALIDEDRIRHIAHLTHHALQRDYGIARPRLALAVSIRMPVKTAHWAMKRFASSIRRRRSSAPRGSGSAMRARQTRCSTKTPAGPMTRLSACIMIRA